LIVWKDFWLTFPHIPSPTLGNEIRINSAIDQDQTAVSAVLAFHEATTDIDYFLQHWTGYFANAACREKATNLASLLDEGIKSRIAQGWLDEPE
jgi:hypothetical protein